MGSHRPGQCQNEIFSESKLKSEISELIELKIISAKIDYMGGVIVQQETDKRQQALEQALLAQREFIWKSRALILRQGVLKSGLVVGEQNQGKNQPVQKMEVGESY